MLHFLFDLTNLPLHVENIGFCGAHLLIDRMVIIHILMLCQISHRLAACQNNIAAVRLYLTNNHLKKCCLSGTVRSYESCFFVVFYMKGAAGDNYFFSKGFFDIVTCKYHPILLDKNPVILRNKDAAGLRPALRTHNLGIILYYYNENTTKNN